MSSGIPTRKRDRLRGLFKGQNQAAAATGNSSTSSTPDIHATLPVHNPSPGSPSATTPLATTPPTGTPPASTPPASTSSAPKTFLEEVLQTFSEEDRTLIREHTGTTISDIDGAVQEAYDAAKQKKAECEGKRWSGSDKFGKVAAWIDKIKIVGDVAAGLSPIYAGLPWAGVKLILTATIADSKQMTALVEGLDLALSLANRLKVYFAYFERLPAQSQSTRNFRQALLLLYGKILLFLVQGIRVWSKHSLTRRVQALWQDSELTDFEGKCQKLEERAEIEASNCDRELQLTRQAEATIWKSNLDTALQELHKISAVQISLQRVEVKLDLSKLIVVTGAIYNSWEEGQMSQCLQGTREEILDNIMQWSADPVGKLMFWLCGKAGTGKSTISRTIAKRLSQGAHSRRSRLGATFFFKRGEEGRSHARHFFSTLAVQFADRFPAMRGPIADALDKDSMLCGKNTQDQFEQLLLYPLQKLDAADLPPEPLVVVIDALDECDTSNDIRFFLTLLSRIQPSCGVIVRVFLTSRPETPINLGFGNLEENLHNDVLLEEVQEQTIGRDIRAYFDHEFARIKQDRVVRRPNSAFPDVWPTNQDMDMIVELAVPLFIFATTVCRFVAEADPQKRLKSFLEQRYRATSSHIGKTYLPILEQQLHQGTSQVEKKESRVKFQRIVGTIVLAADPLSVASLAVILELDEDEIYDYLDQLTSVLHVPQDVTSPVKLLHLSFRDFLTDQDREDKENFWIDSSEIHRRLTTQCLRVLDRPNILVQDICHVRLPGFRRTVASQEHIAKYIPRHVAYACRYWPWHLVGSGRKIVDDDETHQFLQQHFLPWLEALSWLGSLTSAIHYINDMLELSTGEQSTKAAALLNDAKRFVLRNRHIIDLAPLQAYHSALLFAPKQSLVRNIFFSHAPKWWTRLPPATKLWDAEIMRFQGQDSITDIIFSPDARLVATLSLREKIALWYVSTGEQKLLIQNRIPLTKIALSGDAQLVAGIEVDDGNKLAVHRWDARTGQALGSYSGLLTDEIFGGKSRLGLVMKSCAAFPADNQLTLCIHDHGSEFWLVNIEQDKVCASTHKLEAHDFIRDAALSSNGCIAVLLTLRGTAQLWDVVAGVLIGAVQIMELEYENDSFVLSHVAISHDGGHVVAQSGRNLTLWNTETGQLSTLGGSVWNRHMVVQSLSRGGRYIVAQGGGGDGPRLIEVSSLLSQTSIGDQDSRHEAAHQLEDMPLWCSDEADWYAVSPGLQMIAAGDFGGKARLFDGRSGELLRQMICPQHDSHDKVDHVVFAPDLHHLATWSEEGSVRLWNISTGNMVPAVKGYAMIASSRTQMLFSPTGQSFVCGSSEHEAVLLWDVTTGESRTLFHEGWASVRILAISWDENHIVVSRTGGDLELYEASSGELLRFLRGRSYLDVAAFSPDGSTIAVIEDHGVRLYDSHTGQHKGFIELRLDILCSINTHLWFSADSASLTTNTGHVVKLDDLKSESYSLLSYRGSWFGHKGVDLLWMPLLRGDWHSDDNGSLAYLEDERGPPSFFQLDHACDELAEIMAVASDPDNASSSIKRRRKVTHMSPD